jgi:transcriptional regulator with XRE-family HTH domain
MTEAKEARPLAEWRKARGLTQMRLAVKTDLTLGTIQSIESARRGVTMRTAQKIADALGVTILDIAWPSEEEIQAKRLGKIEPA